MVGRKYSTSHGPCPQRIVVPMQAICAHESRHGPWPHWRMVLDVHAPDALQSSSHR